MDPVLKMWMFHNWIADQSDKAELAKNQAYLIGSFWDPEAVKQLIGDGGNVFKSTEEEFEESMQMVKSSRIADSPKKDNGVRKRKRRTLKE
jgi:hypothetical protein